MLYLETAHSFLKAVYTTKAYVTNYTFSDSEPSFPGTALSDTDS